MQKVGFDVSFDNQSSFDGFESEKESPNLVILLEFRYHEDKL